jgi:hypothetical protein
MNLGWALIGFTLGLALGGIIEGIARSLGY